MYEFLDYCVEDVMTRDIVTTTPDEPLSSVEKIFEQSSFNGLPVLGQAGELMGLVTKLDLLRAFRFNEDHMFPPYAELMKQSVDSVMSRNLRTVTPLTCLTRVLEILVSAGIKSLPVVDGDELVGIVSREDVVAALRRASAGERPEKLAENHT